MAYNLTGVTDSTNVLDLFSAVDTMTGGIVVSAGLITLWVVLFMVLLRQNPTPEAMFSASIASMVVAVLLMTANVVNVLWAVGFTMVAVVSAVGMFVRK